MTHVLAQCFAIDKLSSDIVRPRLRADFMHREGVRVVEGRGGLRFLNKTLHAVRIRSKVLGQYLQRYFAIESYIPRQINLAHPTGAEWCADFVVAEFCTSSHSHQ